MTSPTGPAPTMTTSGFSATADPIAQEAHAVDLHVDDVTDLEEGRRIHEQADAAGGSGGDDVAELIDEGVGPSNVHVVHEQDRDIIVAANREINEAALYVVS